MARAAEQTVVDASPHGSDSPLKTCANLLKLIAVEETKNRLACQPVNGNPGPSVCGIMADFDGTHVLRMLRKVPGGRPRPWRKGGA
jgi:hypothetical protein